MLEKVCGIQNSVQCHGSFEKASCIKCKTTVPGMEIRDHILQQGIPYCKVCNDNQSFMKPNIVFFGESLGEEFRSIIKEDCKQCDLLLVIGSSLRVNPVALIPRLIAEINPKIPQILINNELVAKPHEWDYFFEGSCDTSVRYIGEQLKWKFVDNSQTLETNKQQTKEKKEEATDNKEKVTIEEKIEKIIAQ